MDAHAKVTIFARYFGQPEFIKYQYLLFKQNVLDDYEFIVVEEARDRRVAKKIRTECNKYGIPCISIPRSAYDTPLLPILDSYISKYAPSFECCISVQYIYDNYIASSENVCLILDNDIFLVSPFSIEKYLGSASFAYVPQDRGSGANHVHYMLANFLIFNPSLMPEKERLNFNMGTILGNNTDAAGYTHFYLRDYKHLGRMVGIYYLCDTDSSLKEKFIEHCPLLFTSRAWSSHYFIDKELFFHIRMGSNWSKDSNYPKMVKEVTFLLDHLSY